MLPQVVIYNWMNLLHDVNCYLFWPGTIYVLGHYVIGTKDVPGQNVAQPYISKISPLFPESQFHRRANLICASHPHTPNLAPLNPAQTFTMFYELRTQLDTPSHILGRSILSFLLFLDTFGKGWKVRRLEGKKIRKLEGWKARILESWKAG